MRAETLAARALRRALRLALPALLAALAGCAIVTAQLNPFATRPQELAEAVVDGEGTEKILLLGLSRVLTGQEEEAALGLRRRESAVSRVREELRKAAGDKRIAALVLRIDSPGGTVTASDVIYHEVRAFAEKKQVPVLAQLMDIATSGGYYVALAADEIAAHPTTVTGSIGTVMFSVNLEGLLDKLGIKNQTLKAGKHKDIGSPLRAMSPEERRILQGILDEFHQHFLSRIRERRPQIPEAALATIADGRVLSAHDALAAGLIDRIGYLDETLAAARARAGIEKAKVVMYRRPDEFSENIYSASVLPPAQVHWAGIDLARLGAERPVFLYLWMPGYGI